MNHPESTNADFSNNGALAAEALGSPVFPLPSQRQQPLPSAPIGTALDREFDQFSVKARYLVCLEAGFQGAASHLRPVIQLAIALGVSRKVLVEWAVGAGYSKGWISSLLSHLLCGQSRRQRGPGAGRRLDPEALAIAAYVRVRYGDRAAKLARSAARLLKAEDLRSAANESRQLIVDHNKPPILDHNKPQYSSHYIAHSDALTQRLP